MKVSILFILVYFIHYSSLIAQNNENAKDLPWYIPSHAKLQFAGNIGMFSIGAGYHLRNPKWEVDLIYGYVPSKYAYKDLHSITAKATWGTLKRSYQEDLEITWIKLGLLQNYSFGQRYFTRLPEHYEKGYYYFSTSLNFGVFYGTEVKYKNSALYWELGTTDKHIINYVKSSYTINFNELWNIGIGIKYYIK